MSDKTPRTDDEQARCVFWRHAPAAGWDFARRLERELTRTPDAREAGMTEEPRSRTHWEGCEEAHHACALAKLTAAKAEIERLEKEKARLERAIPRCVLGE